MTSLRIDRRFCGPPGSGNGGYVAGLFAQALGGGPRTIMLKAPPPLDRDLEVTVSGDEAELRDGDQIVATGAMGAAKVDAPPPPDLDAAVQAEARFSGWHDHAFPTCFVCGPDRAEGDGLRIFPGAVDGPAHQVAASWTPDASLADEDGNLRPEFVWAALDCPGYFAVREAVGGAAVLGRFGATLHVPQIARKRLIVTGWPIAHDGRKHTAGTALHDEDGRLLASAAATWIALKS